MIEKALTGSHKYWGVLTLLGLLVMVAIVFYVRQWNYGLGITGMGRDVSWGLYIANMAFFVGVAASAVMLVLPYYLHNYKEFGRITVLGEFLAVAAVLMVILFVTIDLGQPARVFNLMLHPTPNSVLFWDIVVLSVYLLLNIVIGWTMLDSERKDEPPPRWVKPLIMLSIPWAISIHTVTAFIFSGLAARPFWLTALMAPRFLASAFASGPALLIIAALIIKRVTKFDLGKVALQTLAKIVIYALLITLFFLIVEVFTVFYSGVPEDMAHLQYLLFGLDGHTTLVPWMLSSIILALLAAVLLINPTTRRKESTLGVAAVAVFISIWIEKGLGLIVPGFVPTSTGDIIDYVPTAPEVLITIGVWALGFMILIILYKIATSVMVEREDGQANKLGSPH